MYVNRGVSVFKILPKRLNLALTWTLGLIFLVNVLPGDMSLVGRPDMTRISRRARVLDDLPCMLEVAGRWDNPWRKEARVEEFKSSQIMILSIA